MIVPNCPPRLRQVHGKAVSTSPAGHLPAVVFGHGYASNSIQLDGHEFELLRRRTGRNTLLDLHSTARRPCRCWSTIQEHPISRKPLHVDLLVVKMTRGADRRSADRLTGESTAVEQMGGVLLQLRNSVQVRALPDHLPQSVEIDISPLEDFDQVLHVSDIAVPGDVTLLTDGGEPVARVQAPRVEEAAPAAEVVAEGEEAGAAEASADGRADEESGAELIGPAVVPQASATVRLLLVAALVAGCGGAVPATSSPTITPSSSPTPSASAVPPATASPLPSSSTAPSTTAPASPSVTPSSGPSGLPDAPAWRPLVVPNRTRAARRPDMDGRYGRPRRLHVRRPSQGNHSMSCGATTSRLIHGRSSSRRRRGRRLFRPCRGMGCSGRAC